MAVKPQQVTDAELAILRLLWVHEALTSREIRDQLYPTGTASDQSTVQKLLERLEKKDLVSRDRSAPAHVFRANVTQNALAGRQLEELAEKLTDGSLVPFITHAVSSKRLTRRQREEIRKLLDRLR